MFFGIRFLANYILSKTAVLFTSFCPPVSINNLRKFSVDSREICYRCLHQSSPIIFIVNSCLSNVTSPGIKIARNILRKCVCSVAGNFFALACLCLFICFSLATARRLVGLCVLLNWFTERNCLIFSDVQQKRQEKTRDVPISSKFRIKTQITALGSLTRSCSPQWLSLHLFIKNLSIDHERFLHGNI